MRIENAEKTHRRSKNWAMTTNQSEGRENQQGKADQANNDLSPKEQLALERRSDLEMRTWSKASAIGIHFLGGAPSAEILEN